MKIPPEAPAARLEPAFGALRAIVRNLEDGRDAGAALPAFAGAVHRIGELLWARRAGVPALLAEEVERLATAPAPAGDAPRDALRRRLALGAAQLAGGALRGAPERTNLHLLNEWRAGRGARLVTEATLFTADLPRTGTRLEGMQRGQPSAIGAFAREIRPRFQEGLAAWLRERVRCDEAGLESLAAPSGAGSGLAGMVALLERVAEAGAGWPGGALWRLAHAWCRGLEGGAIPAGAVGRRLLGRADRELRRLGEAPRRCLGAVPSAGLLANLLFYLEQGRPGDAETAALVARFGARHRFRIADLPDSRKSAFLVHLGTGLAEHAARLASRPSGAAGRAALADALDAAADSLGLLGRAGTRREVLELAARLGGGAGGPAAVTEVGEGLRDLALALSGAGGCGDAVEHGEAPAAASRHPARPLRTGQREHGAATSRHPAPPLPVAPGEVPGLPGAGPSPLDRPLEDEEGIPPRLREELARSRDVLARLESARLSPGGAPSTPGPATDAGPAGRAGPAAGPEQAAGDAGRVGNLPAVVASIGRSREQVERECDELRAEIEGLGELTGDLRSQLRRLELAVGAPAGGAAPGSDGAASVLPRLFTGVESLARTQGRLSDLADRIGLLLSRQGRGQRDLDEMFAGARPQAPAAQREVLVVEAGGERVGFLLSGIEGVVRLGPAQRRTLEDGEPTIEHARRPYRVRHLGALLGLASEARLPDAPELVLVALGQRRLALAVDTIVGRRRCLLDPPGDPAAGRSQSREEPPDGGRTPLRIIAPEDLMERSGV